MALDEPGGSSKVVSAQREHDAAAGRAPSELLLRGRAASAERRWRDAYSALSTADADGSLAGPDLDLLADAAFMLGHDDEARAVLERAHHAYLDAGERRLAVRDAFWIGMPLLLHGEIARGTGWLSRGQRLLEHEQEECVERGYLLLPLVFQHEASGDPEAAALTAARAAELAERFGDADLLALALYAQGGVLLRHARVREGLAILDEVMVAATADELSPRVTGIVYCGVIAGCHEVFELRRAQEWTAALSRWCEQQQDLMAFTGRCLVHRAEILECTAPGSMRSRRRDLPARGWPTRRTAPLPPRRSTARASYGASAGSSTARRRRIARRGASASSRSRGSRFCASRRGTEEPRSRRFAARSPRRRSR